MASDKSSPPLPETSATSGLAAVLLANRPALLGFLRSHGAGESAEDLFQDLWLKIELAPVGPVAQPLSYLYRAANNLMLDRYRATRQAVKRERDWSAIADANVEPLVERGLIAREQRCWRRRRWPGSARGRRRCSAVTASTASPSVSLRRSSASASARSKATCATPIAR